MQKNLFHILERVDSTNNYAMAKLRDAAAAHGEAWFAREQFAGRGQRGKNWASMPGMNVALSIIIKPGNAFRTKPFLLSAVTANCCREFLSEAASDKMNVKWPNDIYWRDRKAGGILIENIYKGMDWLWAVIGIGINVNQQQFEDDIPAVSLRIITGNESDPADLARRLYEKLLIEIGAFSEEKLMSTMTHFNASLYKKDEKVLLKKDNAVFETIVKGVNDFGQLLTHDVADRTFNAGEVDWLHDAHRSS